MGSWKEIASNNVPMLPKIKSAARLDGGSIVELVRVTELTYRAEGKSHG